MRTHHPNSRWHPLNRARRPITLPHNEIYYGTYLRIWRRKRRRRARGLYLRSWAQWRWSQQSLFRLGVRLGLTVQPSDRTWWRYI